MRTTYAIVMAGGEGKRMKSSIPKVLNEVGGQPMISRIVSKVALIGVKKVLIVCGKFEREIKQAIEKTTCNIEVVYVKQYIPLGTGDAIKQTLPYLPHMNDNVDVLIINGDTPLINMTLDGFIKCKSPSLMVTSLDNPKGQGRICQNPTTGSFERIVEEKDATDEEKNIQLINCGVYLVSSNDLQRYVPLITDNNAQSEYYLTDICGMMKDTLSLYELPKELQYELINVNTVEDLHTAQVFLCEDYFKAHNLTIRPLEVGDYNKGYLDLLKQLSDTITISSIDEFETLYKQVSSPTQTVYVLEDKLTHQVVANCTLVVERKFIRGGKNVVHIEDVVVDDSYRGLKIGGQLMRYIVAKSALHLDAYKIILDCKEGLEKFYSNSGFNKTAIQMSKYF
jgi:NDP-sugar pyrophosphorylase family protein/predicted GNAT family N-acyltransferase